MWSRARSIASKRYFKSVDRASPSVQARFCNRRFDRDALIRKDVHRGYWKTVQSAALGGSARSLTLPLENVSLAERLMQARRTEDGETEAAARYLHARVQGRGGEAGRERAQHGRGSTQARAVRSDTLQLGQEQARWRGVGRRRQQARQCPRDGNQPAEGRAGTRQDGA